MFITFVLYVLEDESGVQTRSKIKIKIHETLPNGQYNEINPESPYSILSIQNNTTRSSQVSIILYTIVLQNIPFRQTILKHTERYYSW